MKNNVNELRKYFIANGKERNQGDTKTHIIVTKEIAQYYGIDLAYYKLRVESLHKLMYENAPTKVIESTVLLVMQNLGFDINDESIKKFAKQVANGSIKIECFKETSTLTNESKEQRKYLLDLIEKAEIDGNTLESERLSLVLADYMETKAKYESYTVKPNTANAFRKSFESRLSSFLAQVEYERTFTSASNTNTKKWLAYIEKANKLNNQGYDIDIESFKKSCDINGLCLAVKVAFNDLQEKTLAKIGETVQEKTQNIA